MVVEKSAAFNELVAYLCSKDYAVIVDGKAVLTKKFYEIFPPPNTTVIQYSSNVENLGKIINPHLYSSSQNLNNPTAEEKKQIWTKFCEDASIPFRVKAPGGGEYTVKHYSVGAVNKLLSILRNKDLDYNRFTESTRHYYKTVAYKLTLQRYLCEEVWADEYKNFGKQKQTSNDGSSKWED